MSSVTNEFRSSAPLWTLNRIFFAIAGVAGLLLPASNLHAQQFGAFAQRQTEQAIKSLSPGAQKTVEELGKLNSIPVEDWRYHVGELADGQSPTFDDSSWTIAKPPLRTQITDVMWFRKVIEVPNTGYDLTGAHAWLQFRGGGTQAIYLNGRRVAMGEDLEPIPLFDEAKPGDKVVVAIRLAKTDEAKVFRGSRVRVDFADNRPNPDDLRVEFISSALLIPSLSANAASDTATLEKAISTVDLQALQARDQNKFDESLKQARQQLEPLKSMLQTASFHETGNSHIDAAWLWPWTETVDVVKRTFGTALQLMNEYPDYTYTQSAAAYNEWMADKYPQMNDEIKRRIKEGRWEIVGGMWVEPDLNMPDGESQVRSLLIGKRWFQKEYGVDVRIGWNPDSFGYNWQLPQIYKKSGVDYFVTQKMSWNDVNQLPLKLFWWQSPDGSKVLTYFPHGYGNTVLSPMGLSNDLANTRQLAPGMNEMLDLYGVGDHGGGPTRAVLDEGNHWAQADKIAPKMEFGLAQPFFSRVEKELASNSSLWNYDSIAKGYTPPPTPPQGKISIPTWNDELYLEFHRGVLTTQANHKRNMRESEEWVLNAEKYASLAWLDGNPYPADELTEAWKKTVFNDFHDLAAGSGIGVIYKDAQRDFDQVHWAANEVSSKALRRLDAGMNTASAGAVPLVVWNPLGWPRSGLADVEVQMPTPTSGSISILDAREHVVPSKVLSYDKKTNTYHVLIEAQHVPSLGYEVLHAVPGTKPFVSDLKADGNTLENSSLKVVVDAKTGCITSLVDKHSGFESFAKGACGNELIAFKDTPKQYDAWNIDADFENVSTKLDMSDSVELVESGPLRAGIKVTRTWQSSKFVQTIWLYTGSDHVDIENDFDWHETHVLLKAAFPLAASSAKATYEIPYGTIDRPTTRNNSWEQAKFEVPALRWADLGDGQHGFSLINESKYGYDAKANVLRISLLRSPTSPDPDADRGHHHFHYALYPHAGDWKTALTERRGYEYNYKLTASQVERHAGGLPLEHSFVSVSAENVLLTAVKKAEDENGIIFRMYEWAGKSGNVEIHLPAGATSATVTNLIEKSEGSQLSVSNNEITVPIHPYEILTVRADYPAEVPR
jgi:alpha-mannosidase